MTARIQTNKPPSPVAPPRRPAGSKVIGGGVGVRLPEDVCEPFSDDGDEEPLVRGGGPILSVGLDLYKRYSQLQVVVHR
jgi:hypothetical protein